LQEIAYNPQLVEAAGAHFDRVAKNILKKDFTIKNPPESVQRMQFSVLLWVTGNIKKIGSFNISAYIYKCRKIERKMP